MTLKLKRTPGLYLVGFMCSGKTTIGRALADRIGWRFSDLDQEIEREQGVEIADIFRDHGEAAFREIESKTLRRCVSRIESGNPCVLALGGGAFAHRGNWDIIENNGVTVWLKCPLEIIEKRIGELDAKRPLANNREQMKQLYFDREKFYQRADFTVDSGCNDPSEVLHQILSLPIF